MSLWVEETQVNETENHYTGDPVEYETFTDSRGELFRAYLQDGWRCTSKVYIGDPPNERPIGWHFEKKSEYEDTREPFMLGLWVTVLSEKTTVTRTSHYA